MKVEKKTKKISLIAIVMSLVTFLVAVQLTIAHSLATRGEKLRQLELKSQELKTANTLLGEEIIKIGSLSRINQEAEKIGLVKAPHVMHLTPQVPVALSHSGASLEP
jgi:cell division protein FtsL